MDNKYCEYYHGNGMCLTGHECYVAKSYKNTPKETIEYQVDKCILRKNAEKILIGVVKNSRELEAKVQ